MDLDLRVRMLDWGLRHSGQASIAGKTREQIVRMRRRPIPRNRLADRVFGGLAGGVHVDDRVVAGGGGEIPIRVYTPVRGGEPRPVVVNIHGGGWVLGGLDEADWLCSTVAAEVDAIVVSVGYRLAPEFPYPAGRDDCYAVTCWVAEHADALGGRGDRLAVMGDSAGGNLAAVTALLARDRGGPGLLHQVLIYPATDLTMQSASLVWEADGPLLTRADVGAYRSHYLSGGADPEDPYVSPQLAPDLSHLPAALVVTAEHDPIRDDGRRFADRLAAAGVATRYTEYIGMPHGFLAFPGLCRSARQAVAEVCSELRRTFSS